jgi:hypothetical protein
MSTLNSAVRYLFGCSLAIVSSTLLFAADAPSTAQPSSAATTSAALPALTKEQREKLASVHEQMASCLRSDKSLSECRSLMLQGCRSAMGTTGCPGMMGPGMMGPGMGPGVKKPPEPPPTTK